MYYTQGVLPVAKRVIQRVAKCIRSQHSKVALKALEVLLLGLVGAGWFRLVAQLVRLVCGAERAGGQAVAPDVEETRSQPFVL
jgi:hypothetical protein